LALVIQICRKKPSSTGADKIWGSTVAGGGSGAGVDASLAALGVVAGSLAAPELAAWSVGVAGVGSFWAKAKLGSPTKTQNKTRIRALMVKFSRQGLTAPYLRDLMVKTRKKMRKIIIYKRIIK
jgi:hypothetical protein